MNLKSKIISFWDLPLNKISVKLKKGFKEKIFLDAKREFINFNNLCDNIRVKYDTLMSYYYDKNFIPLNIRERPTDGARHITRNTIKAAPLIITQRHLRNHRAQAILINSGNANCFTGHFGLVYAKRTAELTAQYLGIPVGDVLVSSTGIIGRPLPFEMIAKAIPALTEGLDRNKGHRAAQAILTTDKSQKECAVRFNLNGKKITIGACAKGAGMVEPHMATMLAFITTDCAIKAKMLKLALKNSVNLSFNCITVDGCMSTNDMVIAMANGQAQNKIINAKGSDFHIFQETLNHLCLDLAKKIVRDGEGATKFIEILVEGAQSIRQAKMVGLKIGNSNLVKTAAYGSNPNWGRVAAAVGSLGLKVSEKQLKIKFSSFKNRHIYITVNLHRGSHQARIYTCDLSKEYITINGEYH